MQLPPLRDAIARHGLDARKNLGQHFLLDPSITSHIVALAGDIADRDVVEVGPGPGGLTRALLQGRARRVVAVELDGRAIPLLEELRLFYPDKLHLEHADALRLDMAACSAAPRQVIANLPYNVATPLFIRWLKQAALWERFTLMFQDEVAERICAQPGNKSYGRLAVLAQWVAQCHVVMRIPPGAFSPPPKVNSAVVSVTPHKEQPRPELFRAMEQVTAAAFGQRRKMLRSALKSIQGDHLLEGAEIDGQRRAETLTVEEFAALARLHQEAAQR